MLRAMRSPLILALLLAGSVPAHADVYNRYLFPLGEREALRANAGIAAVSPGSVFYNPAGLAKVEHPQLSVSGTTLMYFRSSTDRLLQFDEAIPYEASGFAPIPASLVSTYKIGSFSLATAILVPDYFQLDNRQTHETPMSRVNILQSIRRQSLWIGAGLARQIGDYVAVGISLFGVRRSSINNTLFQLTSPPMPGFVLSITTSESTSVLGLTAVLGATFDPTPWLTIGVRIEPPFLQIAGTADIYQATLEADGMMSNLTEFDETGVEINDPVPADFGIGFAIRPHPSTTIYADASLQLGKEYNMIDDPPLGPSGPVDLDAAPRFSLGLDVAVTPKLTLHGGGTYNRSASGRLEQGLDAREHYYGGSLGAAWTSGRTRTGLGVFVLRSRGELIPAFAEPGDTEPTRTTVLGGLLTVAYLL